MNTVLIAGAGQLGSRHLQGVKNSSHELDIWVYDLSEESLKVAEERYNQVESNNKTAHFVTILDSVPDTIDVVIVASSSKPRASIVKQILASKQVRYMVLEKFLFPRLDEYDEVGNLLKENRVKAWVNCGRRMSDTYAHVQKFINSSLPVRMQFCAENWGLCCNTIHFFDIFMQLTQESSAEVNIEKLIPKVINSKRPGYVELLGTVEFSTPNGSRLCLTSIENYEGDTSVSITNGENSIFVNEAKGVVVINNVMKQFPLTYQSTVSGILVDEILSNGECRLTDYYESSFYHKTFLRVIGPYINKLTGWTSDSCPIT